MQFSPVSCYFLFLRFIFFPTFRFHLLSFSFRIRVAVCWVVTPCSVVGHQRFRGPRCLVVSSKNQEQNMNLHIKMHISFQSFTPQLSVLPDPRPVSLPTNAVDHLHLTRKYCNETARRRSVDKTGTGSLYIRL